MSKTESQVPQRCPLRPNKYLIARLIQPNDGGSEDTVQTNEKPLVEIGRSNLFDIKVTQMNQEKGPKFHRSGEIVKHSLVGKPELFYRYHYGEKWDGNKRRSTHYLIVNQHKDDEKSVLQKSFEGRINMKKVTTVDKKMQLKMKEQIRTKNQLLDEIESIKSRLTINQKEEQLQNNCLSPLQRQQVTSQARIFEKHDLLISDWDEFIQRSSANLNRDTLKSQLVSSDQFRLKVELAQTFDVMKSDPERFGSRMWYMTLRKNETVFKSHQTIKFKHKYSSVKVEKDAQIPLIINADLPEAFRYTSLGGLKGGMEYIRKPFQSHHQTKFSTDPLSPERSQLMSTHSSLPFHSFQSDRYIQEKLEIDKKRMKPYQKINFNDDLIGLKVQGKNQFLLESNVILSDDGDNNTLYKKYSRMDPKLEQNQGLKLNLQTQIQKGVEEILVSNYSLNQKHILESLQKPLKKKNIHLKQLGREESNETIPNGPMSRNILEK